MGSLGTSRGRSAAPHPSVKFDELPVNAFSLLEAAIKKTRAAPPRLSTPT